MQVGVQNFYIVQIDGEKIYVNFLASGHASMPEGRNQRLWTLSWRKEEIEDKGLTRTKKAAGEGENRRGEVSPKPHSGSDYKRRTKLHSWLGDWLGGLWIDVYLTKNVWFNYTQMLLCEYYDYAQMR